MAAQQSEPASAEGRAPGGGMIGRVDSLDWSRTPLGPRARWPQSLQTAVRIMLTSRFAMWMAWGDELTFFCNDAYLPTLGIKQPWALGAPADEVWEEIWADIGPRIGTVMATGHATWDENLLLFLERSGFTEETYHTFSYSPLPSDSGDVGGMLCVVTEETERVIGGRRLGTMRLVGERLAEVASESEVLATVAGSLATNLYDVPFFSLHLADGNAALSPAATRGLTAAGDTEPAADPRRLGPVWRRCRDLGATDRLPVDEAHLLFPGFPPQPGVWSESPTRAAAVPVPGPTPDAPLGLLLAGLNPYRPFDADYEAFLRLIAGQIGAALSRARTFEAERRRAESLAELDRAKTTFFSNVSHEFRTPLTLMQGPLEEALGSPDLSRRLREELETVHRNGQRLLRLVNTLLDFSRVESGRLQATYVPTDLGPTTLELAASFSSACERAGLGLSLHADPLPAPVYVDGELWEKIVLNLVSNAFKFTFEGHIAVRVTAEAGMAVVRVSDTGTGIPAHQLPHIFERFHRIEGARGRTYEGTGIGLALVQELVRLHGGEVSVESVEDRGTTFTIRLPFGAAHLPPDRIGVSAVVPRSQSRRAAFLGEALRWLPGGDALVADAAPPLAPGHGVEDAGPMPRGDPAPAGAHAPLVLVVDDSADMRDYIARLLQPRYEVMRAADGRSGLAAMRARRPDLVLTDVMMPGLDGFGLLREVRADADLRDLPVIVLSARAGEEARLEGLAAGVDDYLVKPFSARELVGRVDATLRLAAVRSKAAADLRRSEAQFRNMANHAPVMIWIADEAGRCTFRSQSWSEFTGQHLGQSIGDGWLDAVHPEDRERVRRAVGDAGNADLRVEYRLRHRDGGWRWMLDAAQRRLDDDGGAFRGYIGAVVDIDDRRRAEEALRASETFLRTVLDASADCVEILTRDGRLEMINEAGHALLEIEDFGRLRGQPWTVLWPDAARPLAEEAVAAALEGGTGRFSAASPTLRGTLRWWDVAVTPARDAGGSITRLVAALRDVSAAKRHEEHIKLLLSEVNHRSKNLLAVVQALARQTARDTGARAYVDRLGQRIAGLAASQDLLVSSGWQGVSTGDLVRSQLAHHADEIGSRIRLEGPQLLMRPQAAQAIGMTLHELSTNAAKYGALSRDSGRVAITWRCEGDGADAHFHMRWEEREGPAITPPASLGFGHIVMVGMVEQALGGKVRMEYPVSGLVWSLSAPLARVAAEREAPLAPGFTP